MMKIKELFENKKGNSVIYILLAVGILILVMSSSFGDDIPQKETLPTQGDTLCQKTERILSGIKGVGNVDVMISYKDTLPAGTISIGSDSKQPLVDGVLVVADGGANEAVREKIVRAVKVALGVEPHKIEVFERKEEQ